MSSLLLCTPVLEVDRFAQALADSLRGLRALGVGFQYLIVAPERCRAAALAAFSGLDAEFLAEKPGTKGVFDAVAQGFNYAIPRFQPTHLSYINADDLLEKGFGDLARHRSPEGFEIATGEVNWIGGEDQDFGAVSVWPFFRGSAALFEAGIPPFTQQGTIFSSALWVHLGGFDQSFKYIADSVFWHRALSLPGLRRVHLRTVSASYRIRSGQLSGNRAAVNLETARWLDGVRASGSGVLARQSAALAFRFYFSRRYLYRLTRGFKLRTEQAMTEGDFKK
jgi:hypothetical protein